MNENLHTPAAANAAPRQDHLTFRGNLRQSRYGWLRLTPAYSVHLVSELLAPLASRGERVLDPFCGTGTTALACAERGLAAETSDINPFLLWLARAKTRSYSATQIERFRGLATRFDGSFSASATRRVSAWIPPLHQIEKWWTRPVLAALANAREAIAAAEHAESAEVVDLLKLAFSQTLIASANVSFGHQSMSFKRGKDGATKSDAAASRARALSAWRAASATLAGSAASPILRVPTARACDARVLGTAFTKARFTRVITSPPYPNRMSYVRELRPYMYWLGYLADGRAAGELDWSAIGGTWGTATSRVARWEPSGDERVPYRGFAKLVARVEEKSPVLARYIHKYFCDMTAHCRSLRPLLKPGGSVHYIVGNSKFYDVLVPVEQIFAALFEAAGFDDAKVATIRKRTSKPELFEFLVSARA